MVGRDAAVIEGIDAATARESGRRVVAEFAPFACGRTLRFTGFKA
jgi:hypothetical protein